MRTTHFSDSGRGEGRSPHRDPSGQRPQDRDPLWTETHLWKEHGTRDGDPSLEGTWDQAVRQEVASYPLDRMTDVCENITLPQASFAGGNNQ